MSNLGKERELSIREPLLFFYIMLVSFLQTHGGKQLLITSRSGVLRTFSDNSKDESHDIIIQAHMQSTRIYLNISEKNTRLRNNVIYLAPNETKTSDNMDVMHICHPVK